MQKNIAPLRPELLLALHVVAQYLREFRHSEERDEDGYPLIDEAQEWMQSLTDDLLWGPLFFESAEEESPDRSNMAMLFELMPKGAPAGIRCSIRLPEDKEYEKALHERIKFHLFDRAGEEHLAQELLARKKVESTLGKSFDICKTLIMVRDKLLLAAHSGSKTDQISIDHYGDRPVALDFESQRDATYRWMASILANYCTAFREGRVAWGYNVRRWVEQKKFFLERLAKEHELYGSDFRISSSLEQDAALKTLETLLCLELEGALSIGQPRKKNDFQCELFISMHDPEKNAQKSEGAWISCCDFFFQRKPELALKMGEIVLTFNMKAKSKTKDADRRKALRVLERFVPSKNGELARLYEDAHRLTSLMRIKADSLDTQLSIANKILRQIGSKYTISKKAGNTEDQLGFVTY